MSERLTKEERESIREGVSDKDDNHIPNWPDAAVWALLDECDALEAERDEARAAISQNRQIHDAQIEEMSAKFSEARYCECGREYCAPLCGICDNDD